MLLLQKWILGMDAQTFSRIILLGFLGVFAMMDICSRRLSQRLLAAAVAVALFMRLVVEKSVITEVFMGMLPGLAVFAVAYLTREQIGYADVCVILFVGIMSGIKTTIVALAFASISAAVFSLALYVFQKVSHKAEIPFVPFIAAATVASVCL